jgi:Trp operon repressor
MDALNDQFGGLKVQELLLDSGEYVYVQSLSIYAIRALQDKAEELFPAPDKSEYEKPLPEDKAIEPGQVIPAEENPDYQQRMKIIEEQRSQYVNHQAIVLCVHPRVEKEALIKKYAARLEQMRQIMVVPPDEWEATLKMCVIASQEDSGQIAVAIRGLNTIPSEEEVVDGMRIFRPLLRKEKPYRNNRKSQSSRIATQDTAETQPGDGTIRSGASVGISEAQSDVTNRE